MSGIFEWEGTSENLFICERIDGMVWLVSTGTWENYREGFKFWRTSTGVWESIGHEQFPFELAWQNLGVYEDDPDVPYDPGYTKIAMALSER